MKRIMLMITLCSVMGLTNAIQHWPKFAGNKSVSDVPAVYQDLDDDNDKKHVGHSSTNNSYTIMQPNGATPVKQTFNFYGSQGGGSSSRNSRTGRSLTRTVIKYGAACVVAMYAINQFAHVVTTPETWTAYFAQGFFKQVGNWSGNWMSYFGSAGILAMMVSLRNQGIDVAKKAVMGVATG